MWHMRKATGEFDDDFLEQIRRLSKRKRELEFIEKATIGDYDSVSAILESFPDLDRDCVDEKGRSALRLAIRRQQTPVVETLLDVSSPENIYNSLLLSIDNDNDDVSEIIINHPTYRDYSKEKQKEIEQGIASGGKEDETLFSQDVTPLMLAAQREQTYIVQLLLELDERIEEPHKYDCPCNDCRATDTGESLKTARARLNAYRGLCSRAYILQTSKDPILRAFALFDKTQWLSTQEKHFKKEYCQMGEQLGELIAKLLDRVRTEEELDELLHEVAGAHPNQDPEEGAASKEFTRLNLALYRKQKTFVSHPYCQRKLMSLWFGSQSFQQKGQSLLETLLKSFYLMLLYPVLAVMYWVMPDSKIGKQISAPIIKFTATVLSYFIFVGLIVGHSVIKTPTAGVTLSEHPTIGPHYRGYAGISSMELGKLRNIQHFHSRKLKSVDSEPVGIYVDAPFVIDFITVDDNMTDYPSTTVVTNQTSDYGTTGTSSQQPEFPETSTNSMTDYQSTMVTNQTFDYGTNGTSSQQPEFPETSTNSMRDYPSTTVVTNQTTDYGTTGTTSQQPEFPETTTNNIIIPETTSTPLTTASVTTGPIEITESTTENGNITEPEIIADMMIRYHSVDALTIVICIWIIGYLVHDLKEVYSEPLGYYLDSYFNIMDICMLTFYITSFTLRFVTIGKVQSAVRYLSTAEAWQSLQTSSGTVKAMNADEALSHLYWINADRYYWDTFDPYVFCEALYAVANILIICRLAGLLIVNEAMGPLIISLGMMIDDIARFMILFGLVFFAYIIGFLNLYWYYFPDTRSEAEVIEHDLQVNAGDAFGDIELTFTTAFWSLFGMVDADSVEIDEGYAISGVTNRFGYILFGVYNVMAVIVFINILIAMMSSSFERVLESEDMEWKFARTNLYIDFLREGNVLPVPLNLIPIPRDVYRFFKYTLCGSCCGSSKSKNKESHDGIEMRVESGPSASSNVYETPANSESGISSEIGEGSKSENGSENPKMAAEPSGVEDAEEEKEDGDHVSIYSSPEDTEKLWRVRGQLKPELPPSSAYIEVMGKLVHRYFNLGQTTDDASDQDANAASAEKLKNELDSLRNELRMTTFRLKKDLNSLRQDTKSHLTKVEQQCDDVSKQCTDVSKQCYDVSIQCDNITKALQRLFSEMGNLSTGIAELKTISSKPFFLPTFSSKETSPKASAATTYAAETQVKGPSENLRQTPKPSTSATLSLRSANLEMPDVERPDAVVMENLSQQPAPLRALPTLFQGRDKPGTSAREQLQKSDAATPSALTARASSPFPKSAKHTKSKTKPKSIDDNIGPMIENAVQFPIQWFDPLQGYTPQKHSLIASKPETVDNISLIGSEDEGFLLRQYQSDV